MEQIDVAYFSEQLGLTAEEVEGSVKDGTLSQRIKDKTKDQVVYKTTAEFDAFKGNYKTEVENTYFTDMVEKAKKADVPQDLYAPIKGAALQQFSRETAKKHGVENYTDANDLIDQLVKTSANGNGDPKLQERLDELKQTNLDLVKEKDEAIKTVEGKYRGQSLEKEKSALLSAVPFDFSNVKADELESSKVKTQTLLRSVFDAAYELDFNEAGKLVVKSKTDGEVLKNKATLDPIPANDVMISTAKEYNLKLTSPDTGGQGGSSSNKSTGSYANIEEFDADMKAKGIKSTDPKHTEEWKNSGLANITK